jgi:hypothetical protein
MQPRSDNVEPIGRGRSPAWHRYLGAQYRLLRWLDPLIRAWWRLAGIGITVDLEVPGRRTGRQRQVLVGLLRVDGHWYVGHPNGRAQWTKNLAEAREAAVIFHRERVRVRAERLHDGVERDAVIVATASQQPFPGNLVYRLARRHILAVGDYFRLEPLE